MSNWFCLASPGSLLRLALLIFAWIRSASPHLVAEEHSLEHGTSRDHPRLGTGRQTKQIQLRAYQGRNGGGGRKNEKILPAC